MTKYLPWFLFLTGIQTYAHTISTHEMVTSESNSTDTQMVRDFVAFNCKAVGNSSEAQHRESALIELRKNPSSLTHTLRANISFNLIIRTQEGKAAVYVNGGTFAVLKKDQNKNSYSYFSSHFENTKNETHQSIYRVDQIRMDETLHQFTARMRVSQRTIKEHTIRPHFSNYLTRTYQCVSE
jgi:hypothetical protein